MCSDFGLRTTREGCPLNRIVVVLMKHVFILNPAAGKGSEIEPLKEKIRSECERLGAEYLIHITDKPGDATEFILRECAKGGALCGTRCRFYACGGDGTISEVLDGTARIEGAEIGVIPIGTGNDFCRSCSPREAFFDIEAQINGTAVPLDAVSCNGRYSANMINIGFDCEVVKDTVRLKRKAWVPGGLAYVFGLVRTLVRKPGASFTLSLDGGAPERCELLLCAVANGPYCGGGFDALPMAELADGKVNIIKVKNISRLKFLTLVKQYKDGTLPENRKVDSLREYVTCSHAVFEFDREQAVCIDGEICELRRLEIQVIPGGFMFSVPRGATLASALPETLTAERDAVADAVGV